MRDGIVNAIITKARITQEDRGCLMVWLDLDYGGMSQSFGGYALYLKPEMKHHKIESYAGHFISRCMTIAGVDRWEQLTGKAIRVESKNGLIKGIGHIIENVWFFPAEDFEKVKKESEQL